VVVIVDVVFVVVVEVLVEVVVLNIPSVRRVGIKGKNVPYEAGSDNDDVSCLLQIDSLEKAIEYIHFNIKFYSIRSSMTVHDQNAPCYDYN
jgi:hypothetical protein